MQEAVHFVGSGTSGGSNQSLPWPVGSGGRESLLCSIPNNIKENVWYDMKRRPSEYVRATYLLVREREKAISRNEEKEVGREKAVSGDEEKKVVGRDFYFAPLRTSCVPRNLQVDTTTLVTILFTHKQMTAMRKDKTMEEYKKLVWGEFLGLQKVNKKTKKYSFHGLIHTDGVSVSLIYSRN